MEFQISLTALVIYGIIFVVYLAVIPRLHRSPRISGILNFSIWLLFSILYWTLMIQKDIVITFVK